MLVAVGKEDLIIMLESQIENWKEIGGGANYEAYEFNIEEVNRQQLTDLGFFENRDSWIAGVQIKKLTTYLNEIKQSSFIRI